MTKSDQPQTTPHKRFILWAHPNFMLEPLGETADLTYGKILR
jgi:hypothetical protein